MDVIVRCVYGGPYNGLPRENFGSAGSFFITLDQNHRF